MGWKVASKNLSQNRLFTATCLLIFTDFCYFDIKVLYIKLLTRLQIVQILIYQRSLQFSLLHCGDFYTTEGQNRFPENLGTRERKSAL